MRSGALPCPRFPALSVSLEGAGTGKILNVRHAVVPSLDRIRDEIGLQNGCFPTARLAPPRAAKFPWFVAACLHQYCERNDVGFVRRPLLDWSSDDLNFVLCDTPHQPRFAQLACASAVKIGAQAGSRLTVASTMAALQWGLVALTAAEAPSQGVHVVVDLSALVPQPGNLFVRLSKQIRSP